MERQRLLLRYGKSARCALIAVVRDHHANMPGPHRDRPGTDRIRVRTPDGEECVIDVWLTIAQDIAQAPPAIEINDAGEFLRWSPAAPDAPLGSDAPAVRVDRVTLEEPSAHARPTVERGLENNPRANPGIVPTEPRRPRET